jgi:hypothetical protein
MTRAVGARTHRVGIDRNADVIAGLRVAPDWDWAIALQNRVILKQRSEQRRGCVSVERRRCRQADHRK